MQDKRQTVKRKIRPTSDFCNGLLVALLSGRNFETKQYEEAIVQDSFSRLREGVLRFMNETSFKNFVMIVRSAGFVDASLIRSRNALNFSYIIYLFLKEAKTPAGKIEQHVRKWLAMSLLTRRYSGSAESAIDFDIRQLNNLGIEEYSRTVFESELSGSFWEVELPKSLEVAIASSPLFKLFAAAQANLDDKGFLSKDIKVRELLAIKCDVHHIFPKRFLKNHGLARNRYNQVANFAITQSEINIAISNKEPKKYFSELIEQCSGGKKRYGNIDSLSALKKNFAMHCIPEGVESIGINNYDDFLVARRKLMAKRLRQWFEGL